MIDKIGELEDPAVWREPSLYRSARLRAWIGTSAIALCVATEAIVTALQLVERFVYPDVDAELDEGNVRAIVLTVAMGWSALAYIVAIVLSASGFLSWLYRTAENVRFIGSRRPQTTPAMTVLCWFIPVVHLFRPYRVVKALYWASEPPTRSLQGDWVRRVPAILPVWWTTWVVMSILGNISFRLSLSHSAGNEELSLWLSVLTFPLTCISAATVLAVLWSIQLRQEALAQYDATVGPAEHGRDDDDNDDDNDDDDDDDDDARPRE